MRWLLPLIAGCGVTEIPWPSPGSTLSPGTSWVIDGEASGQRIGGGGLVAVPALDALVVLAPDYGDGGAFALHVAPEGPRAVLFSDGLAVVEGEQTAQTAVLIGDTSLAVGAASARVDVVDLAALSGRWTPSQVAGSRIEGVDPDGGFGAGLSSGDVDGDGMIELFIGAPDEASRAGRVYLFAGSDVASQGWMDSSDAIFRALGYQEGNGMGTAVSASADLNGDGYADVVACAPGADTAGDDAGGCVLMPGAGSFATEDQHLYDLSQAVFYAQGPEDRMGGAAGALATGDLDGDGQDDLAIGIPGYDGQVADGGAVAVFLGGGFHGGYLLEDADLFAEGPGAAGTALAFDDGDLLVGAPQAGKGALFRIDGGSTGHRILSQDADDSWVGDWPGDEFGCAFAVLAAGDVAVAAPDATATGPGSGRVVVLGAR